MAQLRSTLRVTVLGAEAAHFEWIGSLVIPAGAEVEFVDLGQRCDVIVRCEGVQVAVIGDMVTGQRLLLPPSDQEERATGLALHVLNARQADWSLPAMIREATSLEAIAAVTPGSVLVEPAESPLQAEADDSS